MKKPQQHELSNVNAASRRAHLHAFNVDAASRRAHLHAFNVNAASRRTHLHAFNVDAASRRVRRAFTLPELTAVVVIIAIVGVILIPPLTANMKSSRLPSAASILAADLEYCQSLNISNPSAPCVFRIDPANHHYWIALASATETPISHPGDGQPYDQTFGSGRLTAMQGVLLASAQIPNGTNVATIAFDTFGRPTSGTDLSILLSLGGTTLHVNMRGDTGDISIVSP